MSKAKSGPNGFFNNLFGYASLIGLVLNIVYIFYAWRMGYVLKNPNLIIITLGGSVAILAIVFIFFTFYYNKSLNYLSGLPKDIYQINLDIQKKEKIERSTSEYIHNILHFTRDIICKIDNIKNNSSHTNDEIIKCLKEFETFLQTITSNLQSFFTLITDDKCSVSIKIAKDNKVKTFYRDPVSYRKRKNSDFSLSGSPNIYHINDNYAFHIITSTDYKSNCYIEDDLINSSEYYNTNLQWRSLYYATAVSPISHNLTGSKKDLREIIGFICVDNFSGGFEKKAVEEFLFGISDILFVALKNYETLINIAKHNKINDERVTFYEDWTIS